MLTTDVPIVRRLVTTLPKSQVHTSSANNQKLILDYLRKEFQLLLEKGGTAIRNYDEKAKMGYWQEQGRWPERVAALKEMDKILSTFPTTKQIAAELQLTVAGVWYHLKKLVKQNAIQRVDIGWKPVVD